MSGTLTAGKGDVCHDVLVWLDPREPIAAQKARRSITWTQHLSMFAVCMIVTLSTGTASRAEPSQTPDEWTSATEQFLPTPTSLFDSPISTISHSDASVELQPAISGNETNTPASSANASTSPSSISLAMPAIPSSLSTDLRSDRFWLVNTRHLTCNTCRMNLNQPNFRIHRLDRCGRRLPSGLDDYLGSMDPTRPRIIYIHGNRRDAPTAISQGLFVYRQLVRHRPNDQPIDWVIWSWPSEADSLFLSDVREKAQRTNAQGLYLAWLLREHVVRSQPSGLIGFSFGGRVVSGGLHALAGGTLGRRTIGEPPITGANIDVGLLAPAVDSTWLSSNGYHRLATQNINRMVMLYNHRDIALKYFKFVAGNSKAKALGYVGPRCFAPRYDGTPLPIRARDCAQTVGNHHSEKRYYERTCYAGREMATLIDSVMRVD
ncbi:MAG: hypothetical protein ACF8CQ_20005 [Rhodopirellula sp. JB044]|uniref:hypothetical protein n=1 Tax=Rhodopirellula sp. JB044 TaxID=3342844 RepID=UPI00370CA7E1